MEIIAEPIQRAVAHGRVVKRTVARPDGKTANGTKRGSANKNPNACAQCRRAKQSCIVDEPVNRFGQCQRCSDLGKDGAPRLLCSYSARHISFYANDFVFKHAPPPQGFKEFVEYQPAGPEYDTAKDELNYAMQYFYVEDPHESSSAWSPLFVRQQLAISGTSPYMLTPLMTHHKKVPKLDLDNVPVIKAAWIEHDGDCLVPRPTFAREEKVLTCRRVCSLYGFLDLEHPTTFRPVQLEPGHYRVIWRFQFFDVRDRDVDKEAIWHRLQALAKAHPERVGISRYRNPMAFPQWPGSSDPSFPNRPLLKLSIGYGSSPRRVSDYKLSYGPVAKPVADQVLLPKQDSSPRVDHLVFSNDYWHNKDAGWRFIESKDVFEVVRGRPPVIVVSNIDTGDWQGGFRFGGVELKLCEKPGNGVAGRS